MQQFLSRFLNLLVQLLHVYLSSPVPATASFLCGMQSIQIQTKRYCPIYFSFHIIWTFYTRRNKKITLFTKYYIYIIVHCSCVVCYSNRLSYHGGEKESIVSQSNTSYRLKNKTGNDKFSKLIVTFTLNAKVIVATVS